MNYVVTTTLPPTFGGRTKALLKRTKLLVEKENYKFTLVTTNYNNDYEDIYQHYLDSNFVPKSVDFINIYDFLKSDQKKKKYPIINHKTEMKEYTVQKVEGKKRTYRYFKDGVYEMYKRFNHPNKNLKFIDYMSPNSSKRIKREEFDQEGYLHRKIYYKQNTLSKTQEIMFKKDGNAYVNRLFKGDPNNTVTSVVYFDKDETYFFDSESDFYKFCFEKIIQPNSQVISDARNLDQALIEMNTDNVKKIAVQHSTFHKLEDTSEVRGAYRYLLDYSKHIDYMVFLTEGQKENWEKICDYTANTVTIPHSIKLNETIDNKTNRDPNKFVIVSRLHPGKQIDHAIRAFAKASSSITNIYLEIYGDGEEERKLNKLIKELNMENRIELKGRTNAPDLVFQSAHCSLFTSGFEGLGLTILESLNNGCPVISYDIKYGPSEMIVDDESGYLVEPNNIEDLANHILKTAKRNDFNPRVPKKYSEERFINNWSELLGRPNNNFFIDKLKKIL